MNKRLEFYEQGNALTEIYQNLRDGKESVAWMVVDVIQGGQVKLNDQGERDDMTGLQDLVERLEDGSEQFAAMRLRDPAGLGKSKVVLICWCGEGVPAARKAYFPTHITDAENFFAGFHLRIVGRDAVDVQPTLLIKKVHSTTSTSACDKPTINHAKPASMVTSKPSPVSTTYTRIAAAQADQVQLAPKPPSSTLQPNFQESTSSGLKSTESLPASATSMKTSSSWMTRALSSVGASFDPQSRSATSAAPSRKNSTSSSTPIVRDTPIAASANMRKEDDNSKQLSPVDEKTARQSEMAAMIRARQDRESNDHQPSHIAAPSHDSVSTRSGSVAGLARKFTALAPSDASPQQSPQIARRAQAFNQQNSAPRKTSSGNPAHTWQYKSNADAKPAPNTTLNSRSINPVAPSNKPTETTVSQPTFSESNASKIEPVHNIPTTSAATSQVVRNDEPPAHELTISDDTPKEHVELPDMTSAPAQVNESSEPPHNVDQSLGNMYVAMHSWTAQDASEINLPKGTIAHCLDPLDGTWWVVCEAHNAGAEPTVKGLIPSNYLQPVAELVAQGDTPDTCAMVTYQYDPADEMELELSPGLLVTEIQKPDPEWWQGRVYGTEKVGFFPAAYVRPILP